MTLTPDTLGLIGLAALFTPVVFMLGRFFGQRSIEKNPARYGLQWADQYVIFK